MRNIIIILAFYTISTLAHTPLIHDGKGGGISSADLIKDGINPWWLQNTKEVKYCLEVDLEFSQPVKKVAPLVEKALAYWKIQFQPQEKRRSEKTPLIATQNFIASCESPELRLKFGMGSLSEKEKIYIAEPEKTVGLTVRADYDKKNLKGTGFIYIASDSGKDKRMGITNGIEKPWQYEGLLFWIVVHELGHVFGIPHIPTFPASGVTGIMAQNFADILLSKDYFDKYVLVPEKITSDFWTGGQYWQNCGLKDEAWKWLGASGICVLTQAMSPDTYQVFARSYHGVPIFIGKISDIKLEAKRMEPTVMVQLTEEQTLFSLLKVPFLTAIGFTRTDYSGIFSNEGKQKSVHFEISEKGLKLYGMENDKILLVLNP